MLLPARSVMMMKKPLSRLYVVVCNAQAKQKNTFSRYYNSNNVVEPWTQLLLLMLPMAARESGVMEATPCDHQVAFWILV
jgi:hypothetical protein